VFIDFTTSPIISSPDYPMTTRCWIWGVANSYLILPCIKTTSNFMPETA